ncbi:MAG: methionyl-tRNA formyltransferase [Pseudomonadota bacterium]|nr:methionyl-tRNA formyltransferase [Pseudomonadota bacterium]
MTNHSLRLVFMGTPDFALPTLEALVESGHDLECVYTQPPKPAGRGRAVTASPVQRFAKDRDIEVRSPRSLRGPEAQEEFKALDPDLAIVAAYGLILPALILEAPRLGCVNIHASLLPRWRGAAPIQRALLAGDAMTGITLMQMDEGLDTGDVLRMEEVPVTHETTGQSLHDELAALGGRMIVPLIEDLIAGQVHPEAQPEEGATYAAKLTRQDGLLDWTHAADDLARVVRALSPWPGAWFESGGERIKVLRAESVDDRGAPGELLDDRMTVACGEGALRLVRLQRAGKAPTEGAAFFRGFRHATGSKVRA